MKSYINQGVASGSGTKGVIRLHTALKFLLRRNQERINAIWINAKTPYFRKQSDEPNVSITPAGCGFPSDASGLENQLRTFLKSDLLIR